MGRASIGRDHQFLSRAPGFHCESRQGMLLKKIRFALTERSRLLEYQVAFRRREILAWNGSFAGHEKDGEPDPADEPHQQSFRQALPLVGRSGHDEIEDTETERGLPGLKTTPPSSAGRQAVSLGATRGRS